MNKLNQKNVQSKQAPELTLRDVLAPLFRHRRVVIGTFSVVLVGAILADVVVGVAVLRGENAGCRGAGPQRSGGERGTNRQR